ncbi:cobalamin biosynthesis protein CbiX [Micromonospora sp. WMMD1128]|uniref:sirohydrochlorin chelatase n=1 Tax=unclassified Micromonospora TaxID=2617518 RepID=UPI00248C6DAD|nr:MULTISPECIES: CbiX/SirB N-terminal domain-containing protein [unclassified Micromonospora]WBB74677.1 cobalamin biosynthesis protein CbiX [Micromonospora sp. WMMD1128]WFE31955.1 CbiX/SirB N-terminal domain-containing protein [Micromonospora sp. WMMD975]
MRPAPLTGGAPVVLVAHGSRDPRAAEATRALARAVAATCPGRPVLPSWLDHTEPGPADVLRQLADAGHSRVVLVPLLLTAAYHRKVDIPAAVAAAGAGLDVRVTEVLGPTGGVVDGRLLAALRRRLAEAAGEGADAVVLAAAGTRDPAARASVGRVAAALGAGLGVRCRVSYASAAPPEVGGAVARLRATGARRVAVAAYFLAPGRFHDGVRAAARSAGAVAVADPLTDLPELADLVRRRVDAAVG